MINEQMINMCYSLLLSSDPTIQKNMAVIYDIKDVLSFYKEKITDDIPNQIRNKFECLLHMCELRLKGKTSTTIIDSITLDGKYKNLKDFMEEKAERKLNVIEIKDYLNHIRVRKMFTIIFKHVDRMGDAVTNVRDFSFESLDTAVEDFTSSIKMVYLDIAEGSRSDMLSTETTFNTEKDDMNILFDEIVRKFQRGSCTPTGYDVLDNSVLEGGFEPSRLYIIGGASGSGKSTLLLNMILKSAMGNWHNVINKAKDEKKIYIYITLENSLSESGLRMYQCLFNKTRAEAIEDYTIKKVDIGKMVKETLLSKNNAVVIMKYFPPTQTSTSDVFLLIDEIANEYGKSAIKGIYIDYLDLLKSDVKYDLLRLELGQITVSLKTMAIEYSAPVVVPTQLTRDVYKLGEKQALTLNMVSESVKKVEHADFVGLLVKEPTDDRKIHFKVGKNRSGKSDMSFEFSADFSRFDFKSVKSLSINADTKANDLSTQPIFEIPKEKDRKTARGGRIINITGF